MILSAYCACSKALFRLTRLIYNVVLKCKPGSVKNLKSSQVIIVFHTELFDRQHLKAMVLWQCGLIQDGS